MTHPIIEDLTKRYTTKRYDANKRISEQDMAIILEALRLSPSSINSQPWKFIVIESDEAKERLHQTFVHNFQFNQIHVKAASHIILFAHKTHYTRDDYAKVVDQGIIDGRTAPENREQAFGGFSFAQLNTDGEGYTGHWTNAQTYLALGNVMHALARLGIDSTPLEGVDSDMISQVFEPELAGYRVNVGLAMGYREINEDYNASLPKSRLSKEAVIQVL